MKDNKFYIDETRVWKVVMKVLKYLLIILLALVAIIGICLFTELCQPKKIVNQEAAKIFVEKLKVLTKDTDVVDVDMREMTRKVEWNQLCWSYDLEGGFSLSLYNRKDFGPGNLTYLTLNDNIDAHPTYLKRIKKVSQKKDFIYVYTPCLHVDYDKNYRFRFKKLKGTEDKFIFVGRKLPKTGKGSGINITFVQNWVKITKRYINYEE